jgi:hypothetical protein
MKDSYRTAIKIAGTAVVVGAMALGTFLIYKKSGESSLGKWYMGYLENHYEAMKDAVKDPVGGLKKDIDGIQKLMSGENPQTDKK